VRAWRASLRSQQALLPQKTPPGKKPSAATLQPTSGVLGEWEAPAPTQPTPLERYGNSERQSAFLADGQNPLGEKPQQFPTSVDEVLQYDAKWRTFPEGLIALGRLLSVVDNVDRFGRRSLQMRYHEKLVSPETFVNVAVVARSGRTPNNQSDPSSLALAAMLLGQLAAVRFGSLFFVDAGPLSRWLDVAADELQVSVTELLQAYLTKRSLPLNP